MKRSSYRDQDRAFGQVMLTLRTAIGLTQAGLADILGVSRHAVGGWEAGQSYPKADHLKQFIALGMQQGAFAVGREAAEIRALWRAARQKVLLDEVWLQALLSQQASPFLASPIELARGTHGMSDLPAHKDPQVDWGDALDVPILYGRENELALLARWVVEERCRVVSVLGMGGVGKSAIAVTLMRQVAMQFEVVIWRSLRDAPACGMLLETCLQVLAPQSLGTMPDIFEGQLHLLMDQLRNRRVLLVLDNLEVLLEQDTGTGRIRAGAEGYARLLRRIAETAHRSCLILTSREKPAELVPLEGNSSLVRAVRLAGLDADAGARLLAERDVVGTAHERERLVDIYGGNPQALKIVAQTIVELFGGEIAPFLAQGEVVFGGVRELLREQFERLSAIQQHVFYWLAIVREPASLDELLAALSIPHAPLLIVEALDGLRRRSLIEHGHRSGTFTLQSVVLEYATARLIGEASNEIAQGRLVHLLAYALCQAHAKDYVRQAQEQWLVIPLLDRLHHTYHKQATIEVRVLGLLDKLRSRPQSAQGYGPANLVALLRQLRGHVRSLDLSRLALRGLFLQGVEMQDARLTDAVFQDTIFTEAFDAIRIVAISGDGQLWAAGSRNGEVRVWTESGKTLHRIWQAHLSNMTALAFSPDGRTLASVSFDNTVKLWHVESGTLRWVSWQTSAINAMAFAPDGQWLASGGNDGQISVWAAQNGAEVQTLVDHSAIVSSLAWSPDGKLLASGYIDGNIRIWNPSAAASGTLVQTFAGHTHGVPGLAFAPDGSQLVSAGFDGIVKIWDAPSGRSLHTVLAHSAPMLRVVWSPNGRTLAICSFDHTIWLWSVAEMRLHAVLHGHSGVIYGLAFAPDSRSLLSGSDDGTIRVWDTARGQLLRSIGGYVTTLCDVDWSPDGTRLAAAGADTLVTVWNKADLAPPSVLGGHRWIVGGVAWSPDGQILASGGYDNCIRLWDSATGVHLHEFHDPEAPTTIFLGVAWSPDGRLLACGSYLRGVHVWDMTTRTRSWVGRTEPIILRRVAWNPAGTHLAGAGGDGYVYVWDSDGTLIQHLAGHDGAVVSLAWNPDGNRLASSGGGRTGVELFVWDVSRGKRIQTVAGHPGLATAVAWNQNGDALISGGSDGMLCWWDVKNGQCVRTRQGHQGTVQALKLSPDGTQIASCGDDGAIVLWDMHTGEQTQTLRRDRPYERMDITNLGGISNAQRASLIALGAIDRREDLEPTDNAHPQSLAAESPLPDAQPPTTGNRNVVLGLPFLSTTCIGRDRELAEIARLLVNPACRLLTLIGPGGMGKTRLALEVAAAHTTAFADGAAFVALASIRTPNQIASAISATLNHTYVGQSDSPDQLLSYLRDRHMLLILDNFEHLLDGADLVAAILAQAPRITILVTSRERLNVQSEWLVDINGLTYPSEDTVEADTSQTPINPTIYSAIELFVQRARQVDSRFVVSRDSLATVVRICRHGAGMPLAIELAAATLRTLRLAEVERHIRASGELLATTLRDVPARHRSLRAVFDHSWNLLSEPERTLFCRLAVFRDGWTTVAAEHVAEAKLTTLAALFDKSLIHQDHAAMDGNADPQAVPGAAPRFTMLEPIREYAKERLAATPDDALVRRRHAHYFTLLAEAAMAEWNTPTHDSAIARLRREHNNMRAALGWARDHGAGAEGLRLAEALWKFWRSYGYIDEGRVWLDQMLTLTDTASDPTTSAVRQRGLHAAAWLASDQHDFPAAARLFEQSMELRRALGETEGEIDLRLNAARQARAAGQYQRATTLLEDALSQHRARAEQPNREGTRPTLSVDELGQVLRELGLVLREQGQFRRAADLFAKGVQLHSGVGDRAGVAFALLGLADIARDQGDTAGVRQYGEPSLAILRELGMQWAIGFALNTLAQGAYHEGDLTRASVLIGESVELFRALHAEASLTEILLTQGQIMQAQRNTAAAYAALTESLRLAQIAGPRLFIAAALEGLATLEVVRGRPREALQLVAAATALRSHMDTPLRPADQAARERVLTTARTTLGEDMFAVTWSMAETLSLEQILNDQSSVMLC